MAADEGVAFEDAETKFAKAMPLPDGQNVLLTANSYDNKEGWHLDVALMNLETAATRILIDNGGNARYVPTGHLLFTRGDTLLAAPFDLDRLETTGSPVPLLKGLRVNAAWQAANFEISNDGTLAYDPGGLIASGRSLAVVNRDGVIAPFLEDQRPYEVGAGFSMTDDGRKVAVVIGNPKGIYEIWASDSDRPGLRRLIAYQGEDCHFPVWSSDGERIAFARVGSIEKNGVYVRSADGGDEPVRILAGDPSARIVCAPVQWAPDESFLMVVRVDAGKWDVLLVPVPEEGGEAGEPRELLAAPYNEYGAAISSDGRWLAFSSDEAGTPNFYIAHFRADRTVGRAVQVGERGNGWYYWSADGLSLVYADDCKLMSLPVRFEPSIRGGKPLELADLDDLEAVSGGAAFRVLADRRIVYIRRGEKEGDVTHFNVVLNFFDELRRLVPTDEP